MDQFPSATDIMRDGVENPAQFMLYTLQAKEFENGLTIYALFGDGVNWQLASGILTSMN